MQPSTTGRPTHTRFAVLAFIVGAYMITYMDRVNLASAVPVIQKDLGFSMITIGWIFAAFRWGYALFQIPGGWLGDRIGGRRALALVVVWWSAFTSLTAFAWSALSMGVCRFFFGLGEAGAFPIATRSLSAWILPTERGFAQGVTHAASRVGAALTPALVVMLMLRFGWRAPFVLFGILGLFWAVAWYWFFRDTPSEHHFTNLAERRLIEESVGVRHASAKTVPWRLILLSPSVWTLSLMYFCYGYSIDIYLDWFPKYLNDHRGFNLTQMGFYASLPLLAGAAGDLLGGSISDRLAKRYGNLKAARRGVALAGFILAAIFIVPATLTPNSIASVFYSCGAVLGLELTVGVSWAIPLDIGGDYAGSIASVMNTFGNLGSAVSPILLAYLVKLFSWNMPFLVCSWLCAAGALFSLGVNAEKKIGDEVGAWVKV
ncbi:MAG TPA: MFS transporter [Candidatus Sulfotelmatobacter sp.]|nr:MFS transporter [Candidatus Sulfotelmatobacter sp.]